MQIDKGIIYGLRVGYGLSERFGIEASLGYMPAELSEEGKTRYRNCIILRNLNAGIGIDPGLLDING